MLPGYKHECRVVISSFSFFSSSVNSQSSFGTVIFVVTCSRSISQQSNPKFYSSTSLSRKPNIAIPPTPSISNIRESPLSSAQHKSPTMSSSSSSYGYGQAKGAYTSRPSTSTSCMSNPIRYPLLLVDDCDSNIQPAYSSTASSSLYAHSSRSSSRRYGSKPPVIHNGGGQSYDDNTSSSAPNGSYHR